MNQALYAHMNNKRKMKKKRYMNQVKMAKEFLLQIRKRKAGLLNKYLL
jgi:hypothetical protein